MEVLPAAASVRLIPSTLPSSCAASCSSFVPAAESGGTISAVMTNCFALILVLSFDMGGAPAGFAVQFYGNAYAINDSASAAAMSSIEERPAATIATYCRPSAAAYVIGTAWAESGSSVTQ